MKQVIRKITVIMLVCVMALSFFAGCKDNGSENPSPTDPIDEEDENSYVIRRKKPEVEAQEPVEGTATNFKVNKVFSDDMVLQRDEYIRIYGTAEASDEGKIVSASFKGLNGSATVTNGEWIITLGGTLEASAELGHTLTVSGGNGVSYQFEDVLVGDVYWVIGQSNIQYSLQIMLVETPQSVNKPTKEDAIRVCISNPQSGKFDGGSATKINTDCAINGKSWNEAYRRANSGSAIGYSFAKNIYEANNREVPIGIITFECSGAALSAFMPPEVCEAKGIGNTQSTVNGNTTTRWIWNQMMYPFRHMTISGLVWYQGESDCLNHLYPIYAENLAATYKFYRDTVNQNYHDFPIFLVELPSIYRKPAGHTGDWAFLDMGNIRGAMNDVALLCKNVFIAAGADVWKDKTYWNSLHPKCKAEQAKRLSDLALSVIYDKTDIGMTEGPVAILVEYDSDKKGATITYRSTGDGLKAEGGNLKGYQVLVNGTWTAPSKVEIVNETQVKVSASETITGVRYNCISENSFPDEVNLANSNGVPAISFFNIKE